MAAFVICKYEEYPIKNEVTINHYKYMAVLATCKFDEDRSKLKALSIGHQIWAFAALKGK